MIWFRLALAATMLGVFLYWAGGNRTFKIMFGGMWFMLSRPVVAVTGLLSSAAVMALLWLSALDNGHDPLASPLLLLGISLMCGFGAAVILIGPIWMLRRLMTQPPKLELANGETLMWEFPLNHFLNMESRGGTGYLTDQAIHFVPTRFVVQHSSWSLQRQDIASVEVAAGRLLVLRDRSGAEHWLLMADPRELATAFDTGQEE